MILKVVCVNHLCKQNINIEKQGKGDCTQCIPHEDNKNCSEYKPINLFQMEALGVEPKSPAD